MSSWDENHFTTSLSNSACDPYRLLVNSVRTYAIYLLDTSGRIVSWNAAAKHINGFEAKDVLGRHFEVMFSPEAIADGRPQQDLEQALSNGVFEDVGLHRRKDGTCYWGIYEIVPLQEGDQHIGFSVVVRDITQRMQQEDALRRSEKRYRALVEAAAVIVWKAAPDGNVLEGSTGWSEFSGMEDSNTIDWGWLDAVHPDDRSDVADRWRNAVTSGQAYQSAYRMRRKDGTWRFIRARAVPIKNEQGLVTEWVGVCEDMTDSRQGEEQLQASERRYRALVENSWDGVLLVNEQCEFIDITPAGERILGYTKEELVGKTGFDVVSQEESESAHTRFEELLRDPSLVTRSQRRLQHRDGTVRLLEFTTRNMLAEPSIRAVVSNFRDVTEQKRLEDQYLQSQKMEAIGQLAAGVAHDFNNILTVINSYCELILRHHSLSEPIEDYVSEIHNVGKHAEALTRQLLTFSRKDVRVEKTWDLNAIVARTEPMIRRLLRENVQLQLTLAPEPTLVKADQGQIEQLLINLMVNACDAMPMGGFLRIETTNVELDDTYCQRHTELRPGPYVTLVVSDSGAGMEASTLAHIFEPFFTTKETGAGTGLGLATVHSIVTHGGGHIDVHSELGVGTTFSVYLPQAKVRPTKKAANDPPAKSLRGTETILLVEDEESVRLVIRRVLMDVGYAVLEAGDGREASKILDAYPGKIDLVMSDVVMPHFSGRRLTEQIAAQRPHCKLIFISGYTSDTVLRHGVEKEKFAFVHKPVPPTVLLQEIRRVLDGPRNTHTGVEHPAS